MITAKLGEKIVNCFDGELNKETLKKWASKSILICPVCSKPYEYCHGKIISPYFRHKDKTECLVKYNEPETEEHIKGKQLLYEWLNELNEVSNLMLEGWLPETHQRPDLMFKFNNEKFVIEFQCSPIATEYLERHKLYQSAGINDIWILGTEKYTGNKFIEKEIDVYLSVKDKTFKISKSLLQRKFHDWNKYYFSNIILSNIEIDKINKNLVVTDEFIEPYLEENRIKTIEINYKNQRFIEYLATIKKYIYELNDIYKTVNNHCYFEFFKKNNNSPYNAKIKFSSDVTDDLIFFIKDNTIDVCVMSFYRRPYFGWSSKKYKSVIKGWEDAVRYNRIDELLFDENLLLSVKTAVHNYIINKLREIYVVKYRRIK